MSGILQTLFLGAVATVKDAYFNLVTLLLNTTSTNGAQNNTFLDSSTNNFTITRNGNTTQGTFTPFSQTGWSNYFDGSSYLQTPSTSVFNVATGNFTFEAWIYPTSIAANTLIFTAYGAGGSGGIGIGFQTASLWGIVQAGIAWGLTSSTMPILNQWNHIVACRGGISTNQTALFLNGTRIATGTYATAFSATSTYGIGWDGSNTKFSGYISNLRFNTTDVYGYTNSTITVPTSNLSAITGTALLTCQSNRFVDNSTNAFAITANGTPSVQAFSPFAPTAAYDSNVVGGSGYFDGTGDYLTCSVSASPTGTQNFTIEGWIYVPTTNTEYAILDNNNSSGGFYLRVNTSGQINVVQTNTVGILTSTTSIKANSWNYFCVTRSGNTFNIYLNSTSVDSTTSNSVSFSTGTGTVIGAYYNGALNFTGYMSSLRVVIGTATAPSSVPTAPFTAITNTALLLNFTNAGIYDSASKNDLETVGNAQVSTTQAKWGSTSMAFDGTGDWLQTQTTTNGNYNFTFGSADFTIEMWVYPTNSNSVCLIQGQTDNSTISGGSFLLRYTGTTDFYSGGTAYSCTSATPTANQWSHIAYVRNGTSLKTYLNGTQVGTATLPSSTTAMNVGSTNNATRIGAYVDGTGGFTGYIDDLRITKGYARYTANFTPPTAAFPIQ